MLLVPLSRDDYYEESASFRLTSDLAPTVKLDLNGTLGRMLTIAANGGEQNSSTDYLRTPEQIVANFSGLNFTDSRLFLDSYHSLATVRNSSLSAKVTSVLSPTAFAEGQVEYVRRSYDTAPVATRNTSRVYELFPGYFVDETPYGWDSLALGGIGSGMVLGGHTSTARDKSILSSTTVKGNVTAQLDAHNQVKAGFEVVANDLQLDYGVVNLAFPETNNYVRERHFPIRGAVFAQDKLEFGGFVANLGLRLDYSNANVEWFDVGTFEKSFFTSSFDPARSYPMTQATAQWTLSPRLGVSHPITENSKLYFNYGHFKQLPTYEQLLRYSRNVTGALRNIGDPDLLMASTIAYELGFDYSFLDDYLVQIAGFYRDISDQQDFTTYISNATSGNFQYTRPNNNSYQDIRGLEVTVRKTGGTWWSGFVNYTYQSAKSGRFNTDRIYQDITDQRRYDLNTRNLYQFRPIPTPYARMNLQFFTPPDLGPALAGQSLLGDWAVSIIGDWRSGGFATWNPNSDPSIENNVPLVDYLNVNLRISKTFTIGPAHLMLFADVQNVLDTRRLNLNSFYDGNDQRDYYNSLHLPTNPGYENIAGEDKVGDYRRDGAAFQPVEVVGALGNITVPDPKVIYFEKSSRRYAAFVNNAWADVEAGRLQQMFDDKAYIDMPNMSSFWFLNPRQVFWGLRMTFDF
jgi:outer membrane receptor protein involved in Fe transport